MSGNQTKGAANHRGSERWPTKVHHAKIYCPRLCIQSRPNAATVLTAELTLLQIMKDIWRDIRAKPHATWSTPIDRTHPTLALPSARHRHLISFLQKSRLAFG